MYIIKSHKNSQNIFFLSPARKSFIHFCVIFYTYFIDLGINRQYSPEVLAALQSVQFIAQHIKDEDKDNEVNTV